MANTSEPGNQLTTTSSPTEVPVLPLRDVVVYPHMVIPLFVGREKSIHALDAAMQDSKQILLIAQKSADIDEPTIDDVHEIGTLATILQLLKLPDGTIKVLVEGTQRAKVEGLTETDDYFVANYTLLEDVHTDDDQVEEGREVEILSRSILGVFDQYVKLNKKVPAEILTSLAGIDEPSRLSDTIAAHMSLKLDEKQKMLEIANVHERLEYLMGLIDAEIDLLQIEKRIRGRVKQQMEKSQREYYLNEQMKAIQKELGDMDDVPNEIEELEKRIKEAGMSKEAGKKANNELSKLKMMSPMSAEATVVRNYIDWLADCPWKKKTKISKDLAAAETILNDDHYGLEKVKERILEYLAVQQRVKKLKGPILCLVGPPGVGKTSLGQSIARATNRKYTRMALGGVRDESEIRGHRRTYIGSLPGKVIQNLSKIGTRNPLFLLDEIDKMAADFRGDPASALLEVLDPEQNHTFSDHYLEVDFDLSDVMFVATANTMNIPAPLLDRMEVIRLPGYTEDEKVAIARNYLLPKQMENNGLNKNELQISQSALHDIVRYYTREAGVRGIEREIAKICRKVVKRMVLEPKTAESKTPESKTPESKTPESKTPESKTKATSVTSRNIEKYLGVKRFRYGVAEDNDQVGQVNGLAWTEVGGELLTIEAAVMPGKGKLSITGQLGDVMQESIQAAMTVIRSRSAALGLLPAFQEDKDIHVHVPEGATPKDGPSAGVGMCTALASALTGIPVRASVAMTGEITLRGEILPIGGLKEKLLAAHRAGIATVLIPHENEKDLVEMPKNILAKLDVKPVRWIDEVLELALQKLPTPLEEATASSRKTSTKGKKSNDTLRHH